MDRDKVVDISLEGLLEEVNKKRQEQKNVYTKDAPRSRSIVSMRAFYKANSPAYSYYKDWADRIYLSDQLSSKMQEKLSKLWEDAADGNNFCNIQDDRVSCEDIKLRPIDLEKDVLDDFTILSIGRRRSGKTHTSRWILYHLRHRYPFAIVITGTKLNNFWSQYIPQEFIYDVDNMEEILKTILQRQKMVLANAHLGIDPRMVVILDDVMTDKYRVRFSTSLSTIFTNGRHLKMLLLVNVQDPRGVGPDLRENTDLALVWRVYEGERKKIIYREWMSYWEDRKETEIARFFWNNTGLINPKTGKNFQENRQTTDDDLAKMVPQSIGILQGRTTSNLNNIFVKVVSEDPGPFMLGDPRYYSAASTGNYEPIYYTDKRHIKVKKVESS
jgi:hypothetical protein